jgi:hypothetical protein
MAGAVALTVAAVLLMSAAWFYFFSPTFDRSEPFAHHHFVLEGFASKNVTFSAEEGQTITISTSLKHRGLLHWELLYNVQVFDPDGELVMRQENVSGWGTHEFKAPKSGDYVVEMESLSNETTTANVDLRRTVTYRPAAHIGTWFLMMALPVLVFGVLAMIIKQGE